MNLSDFDYHLPPELIAQTPAEPRDSSRLMVLVREDGSVQHRTFADLPDLLREGDALVLNDTRVLHARLHAVREHTGGRVELLLIRQLGEECWEAMARPARRLREGEILVLPSGVRLRVLGRTAAGTVELETPGELIETLEEHGELPLPPYIRGYIGDPGRYQTVYAVADGSVAAPTAGLHFTPELLTRLRQRGLSVHYVTLHVGPGTFKPVQVAKLEEHVMHRERYLVPAELPPTLERTRSLGGRVVAVGTTTVRSLESVAHQPELAGEWHETDIFIRPGYTFKWVDGMVTNFHLPRSTLLMLVSAFAGREHVLRAYDVAIEERYRFYSFGDAMLML